MHSSFEIKQNRLIIDVAKKINAEFKVDGQGDFITMKEKLKDKWGFTHLP